MPSVDKAVTALKDAELFILDMDGTLYVSDDVINGAREFTDEILRTNRRLVYFTNNSSRSTDAYYKRLSSLGFSAPQGSVITSGDVTAEYIARNYASKRVFLLGTPALRESFRLHGVTLADIGEDADIVVSAFDTTLTYAGLERACTLIRGGAAFLSTHEDINCPVKGGFVPDSGAICALITASTGIAPRYFGKPHAETAGYIAACTGVPSNKCVVVGDRLYTDIAFGRANGILSLLVLSGETTRAMLDCAPEKFKPDLVFDSVAQITPYLKCRTE